MIELMKIREYTPKGQSKPKKFDAPFDPPILAESIDELFSDTYKFTSKIPVGEDYNVFYTLGHMPADKTGRGRKWDRQDVIPWDIDNCEYIDDMPNPKYLGVIADALNVDLTKCVLIATGNGLQCVIKPREIIKDASWFVTNQKYYVALADKINDALKANGLPGSVDTSACGPNRLFRLPNTTNVKPNRPKRVAKIIHGKLETLDWDLKAVSGLPEIPTEEAIPSKTFSRLRLDAEAVLDGCEFLKTAKSTPQNMTEPLWYALLSIVGRLPSGEKLAHEYSRDHHGYSERETDRKLTQALDASGPRTCESINKHWGNCKSCPNYNKVTSPISLRGKNFIATLDSNFHIISKKGALVPVYSDLAKFYEQKHSFSNSNRSHYVWTGSHWEHTPDEKIKEFAQEHFSHELCNNQKASEFFGLITRTHIKPQDFFNLSTDRMLNLKNGILNIDTSTLSPHSPSHGFQWTLPFNYDPLAKCPTFDKFMKNITVDDPTLEAVLLEWMGYCLSNDEPSLSQKFALLRGTGSNGKNAFVQILRALACGANTSLSAKQLLNTFDTTALQWSLFNIIDEMPKYQDSDFWERLKGLTGGTSITASRKGKDAFQFVVKTKIMMLVNQMPTGGEPSHGLFRRFLILPFDAKFSKDSGNLDKHIATDIIKNELSGVLNKVLEAYHRFVASEYEFTKCERIDTELEQYKREADPVTQWCDENIIEADITKEFTPHEWFKKADSGDLVGVVSEMRQSHAKWCEAQGNKYPANMVTFSKRLRRYLLDKGLPAEIKQMKVAGIKCQCLRGIGYVTSEEF